ncbi:hypothetical protein UFOVP115_120 [uncultured Caudovirales phage]|uniref:Uncharacterized protein n=1 Tax=uncultured Caudovirales phage TaxID=2100421 RepID=A0A6J5L6R0_9CAUD|nr:hypothetical protein UFOVP115_120 [uncultured Caudovirales phage]
MRISKHQAFQGHPTPKHVYYTGEDLPLDYSILEEPGVAEEESSEGEWSNHVEAVSEPDYEPEKRYRCKNCSQVLLEHQLITHDCDE